ncbi:MAG: fatty acid desaturase [Actinomycetota bacterium]
MAQAPDSRIDSKGLGGMVPPPSALPDVLPTDRLLAGGKAVPEIRAELRTIPQWRSWLAIVAVFVEPVVVIWAAIALAHPVAWVAAFLLMGRAYARFASLGHEAVHRTLLPNKGVNDWVGKWLLSYPSWVPFELYRRAHLDHHRDEMGPREPDIPLYAHYPVPRASLRRKLVRDATGQTGWKLFRGLVRAGLKGKPTAVRILACQLPILAAFTLIGRPELYLFLWLLPHLTVWRVINRLRAIAEHGGMTRSPDRRRTTHDVRQSRLASFWMVPFNIGYHLAHHVDMGVSCWQLPKLQRELVASGWVTDAYTYPNYRTLWRALAAG